MLVLVLVLVAVVVLSLWCGGDVAVAVATGPVLQHVCNGLCMFPSMETTVRPTVTQRQTGSKFADELVWTVSDPLLWVVRIEQERRPHKLT